jgi:hypothetical protein
MPDLEISVFVAVELAIAAFDEILISSYLALMSLLYLGQL